MPLDLFQQSLSHGDRVLFDGVGQQDGELVAAEARGYVVDAAVFVYYPAQRFRTQSPTGWPSGVVEEFEIVEVDCEDREGGIVAAGALEFLCDFHVEITPRVQRGERVDVGEFFEFLNQRADAAAAFVTYRAENPGDQAGQERYLRRRHSGRGARRVCGPG